MTKKTKKPATLTVCSEVPLSRVADLGDVVYG